MRRAGVRGRAWFQLDDVYLSFVADFPYELLAVLFNTSADDGAPVFRVRHDAVVVAVDDTYRLRPGAVAERTLTDEWHRCRFLWNEAVHQQRSGGRPTFVRLSKMLTEAPGRNTWLRSGSQVVQQQIMRTYAQALAHSLRVKGQC